VSEPFPDLECKLRPLADPLPAPRPGDWLAEHPEPGQTFAEYVAARPVRKGETLHTLYLCLVGEFTPAQQQVIDTTREYLAVFFDSPVTVNRKVALSDIPARTKRIHPSWGDRQLLTSYLLHEVLRPDRPADALAYLALTASDLWPRDGWNFVFGQANLRQRVGVWSLYRNGDPGEGEATFRLCLRRALATATHETGHILGVRHCTAFRCLMNGSNHQAERDERPLCLCPICLRKLLWNLRAEPAAYQGKLQAFCRAHGLGPERVWYERAMAALRPDNRSSFP
jgi:archaemetzincin